LRRWTWCHSVARRVANQKARQLELQSQAARQLKNHIFVIGFSPFCLLPLKTQIKHNFKLIKTVNRLLIITKYNQIIELKK
ncbi:MAG: hypothetical protein LBH29_01855, partial [Elusimicrobiota bacterium]|jgi:hypothetical protein|nr:hypothetical protein [Elusimicrobiota bacterium]